MTPPATIGPVVRPRRAAGLRCGAGILAIAVLSPGPTPAQLSETSWWPKLQRDAANSGFVPVIGIAAGPHVAGFTRLSGPVTGEHHATPVFSSDNARLYVGGPASTLTAVNASDGTIAWTRQLGDGTGRLLATPAVAADRSIYVGSWDALAPYDGFAKVRDDGPSATIIWTFPMRRMLASPTITADGTVVIAGQHTDGTWAYFGLRDDGASATLLWTAGRLADPTNPSSTGAVGSSPALSADGAFIFGGSDESRTFWQLAASDGAELLRAPLTQYIWAGSPLVTDDGFAFIGEGLSFNPNDATEGKLYAFRLAAGVATPLESLPLAAGHLNGGAAALHPGFSDRGGLRRLYVPANGAGKPNAQLIGIEFDPAGPSAAPPRPALVRRWSVPLGPSASAYPQAVVTRDGVIYVIGPANHTLYAVREAGDSGRVLWSLPLGSITRATGWSPAASRGPAGVTVGPDGSIYWNAPDGYLYTIRGWPAGDMDGNGVVEPADREWLRLAAKEPARYALRFPEVHATAVGDFTGDGALDDADLGRFAELLPPP